MSYELGKLLIRKKHFKQALNIFSKLLAINSNDLKANFQMGKIFYELNNLQKSIIFYEKCNKIQPNTPNILFNLALALQGTGKIKEAKKKYLDLIKINYQDIKSYYGLFILDNKNITSELFKNLEKIIKEDRISSFEKSLIYFIFSKYEKKGKNIKNEIKNLNTSHKLCYDSNIVYNNQSNFYYKNIISNYFKEIYFEDTFTPKKQFNDSSHIFIVGLPRSGSTLVETIITHNTNNIVSLGEFHGINTSILDQIGKKIYSRNFDYQNYKLRLNKKVFQDNLLEKYDNFEKNIFLDKSLENFFNIDIILEFFPKAKFIHTYRNFNDSVIGIYQTMLPELSWSHKISDIKSYINLYNTTINHFKKKYTDKIINVDLNKLTNNKEIETKKILEFCSIKVKKDYLDFDKNKKLYNKTNSFLQVREKISKYENNKYQPYYYLLK